MTYLDLILAAGAEVNIWQAGDTPSGEDTDLALLLINEILDSWNVDERTSVSINFAVYTLTPNLQPHTIGLAANSPTFTIPAPFNTGTGVLGNRPTRIVGANLVLNTTTPNVDSPINIRDDAWWNAQTVKGLTSSIPTDLYYSPDWGAAMNGSIYLWPVPTVAYGLRLELALTLAQTALSNTVVLPPGYLKALRLTLAESMVGPWSVALPQTLPGRAMDARAVVWAANDTVPRLTNDASGFDQSRGRSNWNYRTGQTTT